MWAWFRWTKNFPHTYCVHPNLTHTILLKNLGLSKKFKMSNYSVSNINRHMNRHAKWQPQQDCASQLRNTAAFIASTQTLCLVKAAQLVQNLWTIPNRHRPRRCYYSVGSKGGTRNSSDSSVWATVSGTTPRAASVRLGGRPQTR